MKLLIKLIPFIMMLAGRMTWRHMPENINGVIGYRTSRSMKNMDTWKFADAYCGKLWYKTGKILFLPTIILIISILPTEKALKKNFTEEGIRK